MYVGYGKLPTVNNNDDQMRGYIRVAPTRADVPVLVRRGHTNEEKE